MIAAGTGERPILLFCESAVLKEEAEARAGVGHRVAVGVIHRALDAILRVREHKEAREHRPHDHSVTVEILNIFNHIQKFCGMGNSLEGCCTPTQGMESVNLEGRPRHPANGGRKGPAWGPVAPGQRENPLESSPPGHDFKPRQSPRMQQAAEEIQQVRKYQDVSRGAFSKSEPRV